MNLNTPVVSNLVAHGRRWGCGQVIYSDAYFSLSGLTYGSGAGLGAEYEHFHRTRLGYDSRGRLARVQTPTGTIYRTLFDGLDRPVSEWVGVDDTPASGGWSPGNPAGTDLRKVAGYVYDGDGIGDSNLTQATAYPGNGANQVNQYFYDWRDRPVAAKAGVQSSESTSLNRPIFFVDLDNLGQVIASEMYDGDGVGIVDANSDGVPDKPNSSLLRARSTSSFDEQGRPYRTQKFSVDPSTGAVSSNALTSNVWYAIGGDVIKVSAAGGLVMKYQYDGAGRVTKSFVTDGGGDSGFSDADDVTGDNVLEQAEFGYDANSNAIQTTARRRFHDETGTGELGTPTTGVKARVSYAATWYDKGSRPTASATVGTNGGSAWTRPSTAPARSDAVLVTDVSYNAAGWVETITDPKGLIGKVYYDNLGQTTKTIENYVNGVVSDADDKTTEFIYNGNGQMLTLVASLTGGGFEETRWVYGSRTWTGDGINSNDVLKQTRWPDSTTGSASASEKDVVTVDQLGSTKTFTDRNGNVHRLTYDVLRRMTTDAVTTLGAGVDGAVRRIEVAFDTQGNPFKFTSYDAATGGNVINQVQRDFNGLGQLTKEYQEHAGAVNTGTSLKVQYAWSEMSGGANHSRLNTMTYPNGKMLTFNYSTGLNSNISWLSSISDSTGTLESYDFLGLSTVVRRAHSQLGVDLTYIKQTGESNGDAGDQYTGLDRFDRVVDQRWIKTGDGTHKDRFQYGYDRNSNRLWRDNLVNTAFGEVYQYDGLNQITSFKRGTLNAGKTDVTGTPSRTQTWDHDALGNFDGVDTDGSNQTRTHNKQNEIASISGATTPTFDANGDLTRDETGRTFEYDAWNRLVRVKNSGGTTIAEYKYDAMFRRVSETKSGTMTDFYYSAAWQVLEERVSGNTKVQYVWSPVYVDALILRDRDATGDSTLEERLWVVQDANFNVTALLDNSGVVERYAYDPYGRRTVYDSSWTVLAGGSSYAFTYSFQGRPYDATTGGMDFRFREYFPTLARFAQLDPKGFRAGDVNFYRLESNGPGNYLDPWGLDKFWLTDKEKGPGYPFWSLWDDAWTILKHSDDRMKKPIHRQYDPDQLQSKNLKAGDRIDEETRQWHDQTLTEAPLIIGGTMIMVGTILLPGPDDLIWAALLEKYGVRIVRSAHQGGKKIIQRLYKGGRELNEVETRFLIREYKIANGCAKWSIEGTDKVVRHGKFGKFYRDPKTGLWWSKDTAGHGGSAWKVFKDNGKQLEWVSDADEYGDYIVGKHKSPTGMYIDWKDLVGCSK